MKLSTLALTLGAASSAAARAFDFGNSGPRTLTKRVNHRPDKFWSHVVKGADLAGGEASAASDNNDFDIANFNLRANKVDPSKLGVDDVKQYSGYLDNEQQDKHLFYCEKIHQPWHTPRLAESSHGQ